MIVYRYLSAEEYKNIVEKNLDKIGNTYDSKSLSNTFHYKKNEKYLHFYKHEESMNKMKMLRVRDGQDYYFCKFDIPYRILFWGIGTGYYDGRGYYDIDAVREYIVKVKNFNPEWLLEAKFDEWKHDINVNIEKNNPEIEWE